ncbi:response regulator [Nitrospira lenta]|uniref:Two component transcriptional regulator, LuxR family n=1 Tax=Nitrospira lenta TaxID=1436998 RepID=A0A330L355_9BACT|nr:response regulator transcription factor [Nitrospira lenta]SPP64243.1 Two component transcriptional regulator, LuxR family [Nitrospira lenta]
MRATSKAVRILLVDDHALFRAGLCALLQSFEGVQVVAEAGSGPDAIKLVERDRPNLVLMDIALPGLSGIEAAARITASWPQVRVIILSMHSNEEYVRQALRAGASGYLLKGAEPPELELALKAVMRGETYLAPSVSKKVVDDYLRQGTAQNKGAVLSPRQCEVLKLIAEGGSTKEIAGKLDLSVKTVEGHRAELMRRLEIHDVAGLVRYAIRSGLVAVDS